MNSTDVLEIFANLSDKERRAMLGHFFSDKMGRRLIVLGLMASDEGWPMTPVGGAVQAMLRDEIATRLRIEGIANCWNLNLRKIEANAVCAYRQRFEFESVIASVAKIDSLGAARLATYRDRVLASIDGERMILTTRMERQTAAMVAIIGARARRDLRRAHRATKEGSNL